jgi:hypothetical protein
MLNHARMARKSKPFIRLNILKREEVRQDKQGRRPHRFGGTRPPEGAIYRFVFAPFDESARYCVFVP